MSPSHSDNWSNRIGTVFDSRPRVAVDDLSRWMTRREEKLFRNAVVCPGVHVCLYGPSGSGKTSLAKTMLGRLYNNKRMRYIYTRLNHNSTWESFKSQIIENKQAKKESGKALGVKVGIKSLIPYLEFSGEVGGGTLGGVPSRTEVVQAINIPVLSQFLIDSNVMLVIDDVNFASDDLLLTLTDLAKELTDNSGDSNAKVVFVGADDIFLRIIDINDSLKDRTEEVSLGSVRGDDKGSYIVRYDLVWKFIADGLVQLGLNDPRKDKGINKEQLKDVVGWINHAADGLPKSIVRLGRVIAEKGEYRNRVSYSDILESAEEMTKRNYRHYRSKYRALVYALRKDQVIQEVCLWMFARGASRIHTIDDMAEDLHDYASYAMFEEAIEILREKDFVTVTGGERNVFFARDPLLAHTIGVALKEPEKCGVDKSYFSNDPALNQMLLRFTGDRDPENRGTI